MGSEFETFGPWVQQVRTPQDVPRLYRGHRVDPASALLVLKIPRQIERRDADPSMDLYDHLVVAGQDDLMVLSRTPRGAGVQRVPYEQIVAVQDSVDLLDGRLTVHAARYGAPDGPEGPLTVRYNGASHELLERLVALIRAWSLPAPPDPDPGPTPARLGLMALGVDDIALVTTQRNLSVRDRAAAVRATHPRVAVVPQATPGRPPVLTQLAHRVWPMTLHAAVVCGDEREVQVIGRRDQLVRGRAPEHSVSRTVWPRSRVTDVELVAHVRYAGVSVVRVRLGGTVLEAAVPAGSATAAALLDRDGGRLASGHDDARVDDGAVGDHRGR